MKDLIVQRYNIVTVHSNGETFDDLREKPNGMFCYYKEANESHKEILAERGDPVNELLIEALQAMLNKAYKQNWNDQYPDEVSKAQEAISRALGEE
ncbi:TPA: hypothetical protein ACV5TU_000410 [Salmonella enterica]